MWRAVASSWALLLGMGLLMLGNGLQGTLLGIRATTEGFGTTVTGLVMAGYFLGFISGSTLTPKIIKRVGHVRAFSALASLASTAILVQAVFVDPFSWGFLRLVTGFCYAGIYVVAESWMNDRATNENRGQLLSVYMVVVLGDVALGQFLLNLADPNGYELFVLSSVLISLAMMPIALSAGPTPSFDTPDKVSIWQLYKLSPLGVASAVLNGMANGILIGMGAVYAQEIGFSVSDVALFMGAAIGGGVLFQFPIGRFSDRFDRRRVITVVTLLAAIFAFAALSIGQLSDAFLIVMILLYGGMGFPLYSLSIAHTNDNLAPSQMVAASGTLVLLSGLGASVGPPIAAFAMTAIGPNGFFIMLQSSPRPRTRRSSSGCWATAASSGWR